MQLNPKSASSKHYLRILLAAFFFASTCFGQTKTNQLESAKIKKTVFGFLKWYKVESRDTSLRSYKFFRGGYPDTTTKRRIDTAGVEQYLTVFRQTQLVSETYINNLRAYYHDLDKQLAKMPILKELVKGPGFDGDEILMTFEPEEILDHIDGSKITNTYTIDKKALVRLSISKYVALVFTLSKAGGKWTIDSLSGDTSIKDSFFTQ